MLFSTTVIAFQSVSFHHPSPLHNALFVRLMYCIINQWRYMMAVILYSAPCSQWCHLLSCVCLHGVANTIGGGAEGEGGTLT